MIHAVKFEITFAPETVAHLEAMARKHHRLIQKTIAEQLRYTPDKKTRNRKPLEEPTSFGASWELRFGPDNCFRVFYEVDRAEGKVEILAIGIKERNRLFIGGEEFEL